MAQIFFQSLNGLVENAIIAALLPAKSAVAMNDEEERALREQLARLLQEHRDLDAAIEALVTSPGSDLIQVQRLKKRKLVLRDKIRRIEDQLTPDIIA
ncbi:MAG: YdcH family protein [Sphingobacteriales bacterium]